MRQIEEKIKLFSKRSVYCTLTVEMNQDSTVIQEINQKELPFKSWLSMALALFWRSWIILLGSALVGGIVGFIIGLLGALAKIPKIPIQIFAGLIGFGIGFFFLTILLKWFFKAKFQDFRIAILK